MAQAAIELGVECRSPAETDHQVAEIEARLGRRLPDSVRQVLAYDGVIDAVARAYDAQPGLAFGRLATPIEMPGVDGDVLWLMSENQGVCTWGVPLDQGDDPPVLVGGELGDGDTTCMTYADDVATFVASWAWDLQVQGRTPLVQAGTGPLGEDDEEHLAERFKQRWTTWGYPCPQNIRFESGTGVGILLWACARGTDWTISGPTGRAVGDCLRGLLVRFDLQVGFGAHDEAGIALLRQAREAG